MTFFSHCPLLSRFYLLGARGPNSLSQTAFLPNFPPDYLFLFVFTPVSSFTIIFSLAKVGQTLAIALFPIHPAPNCIRLTYGVPQRHKRNLVTVTVIIGQTLLLHKN